jgi:hypothetical protein
VQCFMVVLGMSIMSWVDELILDPVSTIRM